MGKGILLTVGFVLASVTLLLFGGQRSMLETKDDQGEYQFQALARNVAQSGFDRGVSAIMRDLMDAPTSFERVGMDGGFYDLSITQNLYGDLVVRSDAEGDEAAYQVEGNVLFTAPLPAAVALEDINVDAWGGGFYQVSGVDRRMPSQVANAAGFQTPIPGIMTTESNKGEMGGHFNALRVIGVGSNPDDPVSHSSVKSGFSETFYEALYQEAITKTNLNISHLAPQITRETLVQSALSGSGPGNPKIIRVQGDLYIGSPLNGYGLLIVEDGNLTVGTDDFNWEGMILARKDLDMIDVYGTDTTRISLNHASVYGGLAAYNVGTPPTTECIPNFAVEDNKTVVTDSFRVKLTVLGAAISYGGQYDMPVTARVRIGGETFEPWGDYSLPLDGNVNTGNSGVTYTWEPDQVFPASAISVDARSWVRDGDGTSNDHWNIHMEKDSDVVNDNLDVLLDGNAVPGVGGFMGQYSVEDFLGDYIENDQVKLDGNESINLFELGETNSTSEAFDLQDLVVVVSLIDASAGGCQSDGGSTLEFYVRNESEIHYSSEAIAKLGSRLDTIKDITEVKVASTAGRGTAEGETAVWASVTADDAEDDVPGGTVNPADLITVCHFSVTKSIFETKLVTHIAHGDYLGACTDPDEEEEPEDPEEPGEGQTLVCHLGSPLTINLVDLIGHLLHGDIKGSCN